VNAIGRAAARDGLLRFGNLPAPRQLETLHGLICASTATDKSVALRQLLADIRRRGDRAIFVDAAYYMSETFRRKRRQGAIALRQRGGRLESAERDQGAA
jgi:hypothetical protein